jgi:anti-sigma B factor antagonist/stage II sporulation protein AA (anti-sigma F factor antagonist)
LEFQSRTLANVVLAAPAGRIDHPNARALEQALQPVLGDAGRSAVALVLDFAQVDYISSMGLRALMVAAKTMRARGQRIAVSGLTPAVREIFAIARFDHVLEVFPAVRDALRDISPAALQAYDAAP